MACTARRAQGRDETTDGPPTTSVDVVVVTQHTRTIALVGALWCCGGRCSQRTLLALSGVEC